MYAGAQGVAWLRDNQLALIGKGEVAVHVMEKPECLAKSHGIIKETIRGDEVVNYPLIRS